MKWLVGLICALLSVVCHAQQATSGTSLTPAVLPSPEVQVKAAGDDAKVLSRQLERILRSIPWGTSPGLLIPLLEAGADPNFRDARYSERCPESAVDLAIIMGELGALDLLLNHGGRVEPVAASSGCRTPMERAIISGDEAMVRRVSSLTNATISDACLSQRDDIVWVTLSTTDSFWHLLIREGLGASSPHAQSCGELPSLAERLVLGLMNSSESFTTETGWRLDRLNARLKDLWRPAVSSGQLTQKKIEDLFHTAGNYHRDDILEALRKAGVRDEVTDPARDKAMEKSLIAEYNDLQFTKQIKLEEGGKFSLSEGREPPITGHWSVRNGRVMLRADGPGQDSKWVPFKRVSADGVLLPDNDDPTRFFVVAKYHMTPLSGVWVTAVGCQPSLKFSGATTNREAWSAPFDGPLCQITLTDPRINGGRTFVYKVPKSTDPVASRHFVFELQDPVGNTQSEYQRQVDFNVSMRVLGATLDFKNQQGEFYFWRYCPSPRQFGDSMTGARLGIVNHMADSIFSSSIQGIPNADSPIIIGGSGSDMDAWEGDFAAACASIPRTWYPGLKVLAKWGTQTGRTRVLKKKIVEVEKYGKPGDIFLHVFPNDEVRVVISDRPPWDPSHPIPAPVKPRNRTR